MAGLMRPEIDRLRGVKGAIVEIGVARDMTTRFMAQHLMSLGVNDETIYAIDTFSSFTDDDIGFASRSISTGTQVLIVR